MLEGTPPRVMYEKQNFISVTLSCQTDIRVRIRIFLWKGALWGAV